MNNVKVESCLNCEYCVVSKDERGSIKYGKCLNKKRIHILEDPEGKSDRCPLDDE